MKKYLLYLMTAVAILSFGACSTDHNSEPEQPGTENPDDSKDDDNDTPGNPDGKTLVAYFSWGGTTQRMAQEIAEQTGADIFRIEPVTPYPTDYTQTTEVARAEKDSNARPAIKSKIDNWAQYDTIFIGCPV